MIDNSIKMLKNLIQTKEQKNLLLIMVLMVIALWLLSTNSPLRPPDADIRHISYECSESKSINAGFSGNIVDLELSDGRQVVLDMTDSTDGERFENKSEKIVFVTKGISANISESNKPTFTNCSVK